MTSEDTSEEGISEAELKEFLKGNLVKEMARTLQKVFLAWSTLSEEEQETLFGKEWWWRFQKGHRAFAEYCQKVLGSGEAGADYLIVFDPTGDIPAEQRMAALRRIRGRKGVGPPISRKQWDQYRERFLQAIDEQDSDLESLAEGRVFEAIKELVGSLTRSAFEEYLYDPSSLDKRILTILQRRVPKDLLGPGWRQDKEVEWPTDIEGGRPDSPASLQAWEISEREAQEREATRREMEAFETAIHKAKLSKKELEVVELRREGLSHEGIAEKLGLETAAVRKRYSRALEKLRKAVSP